MLPPHWADSIFALTSNGTVTKWPVTVSRLLFFSEHTVQTSLSHLNIWSLPQWDDVLFKSHEIWHKNESAAIFYTTVPQQSFMTCPLMEFCHCSDVTQNPPQSPSNHVKDRTPFFHRCSLSTAFPPKDDGEGGRDLGSIRLNFCIDLVQK